MPDAIDAVQKVSFSSYWELKTAVGEMAQAIRRGTLDLGKSNYSLPLLMASMEAICCGHNKLTAVEMGVAGGNGLLSLCKAAAHYREHLGVDIQVIGFDNATGLPPPKDFRDHPELWATGDFKMPDPAILRGQLPDFAQLVIGEIAETVESVKHILAEFPLGFVSVDVDFYSSTVSCLRLLDFNPECYMPAVMMYFDDLEVFITNSDWSGEPLAIAEFNTAHATRKLQRHRESRVHRLYSLQVIDHPLRQGTTAPRFPLRIPLP